MFKNKKLLILVVGIAFAYYFLVVILIIFDFKFKPDDNYEVLVYEVNDGYGYTIKDKSKTLIRQDFVPAISGKKAFCNAKDALKVANIVKQRIMEEKTPTIALSDLKKLNLDFKCLDLSIR